MVWLLIFTGVNFYGLCSGILQVHFMPVYRSVECLRNISVALRPILGPYLLFGSLYGDHCLSSDFTSDMHYVM